MVHLQLSTQILQQHCCLIMYYYNALMMALTHHLIHTENDFVLSLVPSRVTIRCLQEHSMTCWAI